MLAVSGAPVACAGGAPAFTSTMGYGFAGMGYGFAGMGHGFAEPIGMPAASGGQPIGWAAQLDSYGAVQWPTPAPDVRAQPMLPPGWDTAVDSSSGRAFYFNRATGVTQWGLPPAAPAPLQDAMADEWRHSGQSGDTRVRVVVPRGDPEQRPTGFRRAA